MHIVRIAFYSHLSKRHNIVLDIPNLWHRYTSLHINGTLYNVFVLVWVSIHLILWHTIKSPLFCLWFRGCWQHEHILCNFCFFQYRWPRPSASRGEWGRAEASSVGTKRKGESPALNTRRVWIARWEWWSNEVTHASNAWEQCVGV